MKIEIGESLCASWLKHVKGCQIVQTNWKCPDFENTLNDEKKIKQVFNKFKNKYKIELGNNELFGRNTYLQLLRQSEVDVVGIDMAGESNRIIAVDVAFHENGLNYGTAQETSAKVIKKFIRTAMSLIGVCKCLNAELYFISPKINKNILEVLNPLMEDLNKSFNEIENFNFKFQLICNEDFKNRIINKVIIESNNVSDTSELFLRSAQLIRLAKADVHQSISTNSDDYKIGKLVQETFKKIISEDKLPYIEITNLCNEKYCNETFGLSSGFSVLKRVVNDDESERFDVTGISRFYIEPLEVKNEKFWLSSQWYEKHRVKYLKWLKKFE